MKVHKADYKFVPVKPDENFSEEHNKKVIEDVIKKNELQFKRNERERKERLRERAHAIASYTKNVKDNKTPEQYFGKKHLAYLRGQEIINKLKNAEKKEQIKTAQL
jgi:hypothetical protein